MQGGREQQRLVHIRGSKALSHGRILSPNTLWKSCHVWCFRRIYSRQTPSCAARSGSPVSAIANQYNSSIPVRFRFSLCGVTSLVGMWRLLVKAERTDFIAAFLLEMECDSAVCSVRILRHACECRYVGVEDPAVRPRSAVAGGRRHRESMLNQR